MLQVIVESYQKAAYVACTDGNNRAKSLYEQFGFKETGKNFRALKYDDGSYADEYIMVKILGY